jgi:hypothetical protein
MPGVEAPWGCGSLTPSQKFQNPIEKKLFLGGNHMMIPVKWNLIPQIKNLIY